MLIKTFEEEGSTYEIRKSFNINRDEIKVQIFDQKKGKPVWFHYTISSDNAHDAKTYGYEPVKKLAKIAQDDFLRRDTDLKFAFSD